MYASDLKHPEATLEEKLYQLYRLNRDKKVDLSFRPPYLELLQALGNPHLNLPPVIHVAGTNGKGSVIAFMRTILENTGYKVHAYTSPHLTRFNERVYLAGQNISDEALENLIDEVLVLNQGRDVTFFEITTALAFAAFSRTSADVLLLEVGMGGRLDCTNVIESAAVSVINTVSYDHMEHLGETLPEIAAEKAGIMKPGMDCVLGPQAKDILYVFENKAEDEGTSLFRYGADWRITAQGDHICYESETASYELPLPGLAGAHQIQNAGVAIAALEMLGKDERFDIEERHLQQGIQNAHWPARLQQLPSNYPGWELWLDGGHNEDAGKAIAAQAEAWQRSDQKPLYLVLGMMAHKDPRTFLEPFLSFIEDIHVIGIPGEPDSLGAGELAAELKTLHPELRIKQADNLSRACISITKGNQTSGRILVAGSLYLAGHILQETGNTAHNKD